MTKIDKLLARVRNNPKAVSFRDIQALLAAFGFVLKRSRGSHHVFSGMVGGRRTRIVIPYRQPHIKAAYVKEALDVIDEIKDNEGSATHVEE